MNEIDIDILSKYDIDIKKTYKGRGAIIVNSVKKSYKLVPYNKTLCRLKFVNELLKHIKEKGFENDPVRCQSCRKAKKQQHNNK